ncbi:hypothetical protein J2X20_000941 [Pelomonas saccharophila]|uniref:Uncharacterized protein n=1 Tax=Roseateles saccharophilus TaxID=304 RepID=A0ABU1YHH5_ROSSA|nr:hypothetical protein [Roseateles saccharophilus]
MPFVTPSEAQISGFSPRSMGHGGDEIAPMPGRCPLSPFILASLRWRALTRVSA